MKTEEGRGYLALLALAFIWGYTWIVIKLATASADPFTVAALRSGIGAACLFVAMLATRRSFRPPPFGPTIALGLLQTTGFTLFQTIAVAAGGAGKAAVLVYTMPFWTVVFAWIFLRDRIGTSGRISLGLAAVGLGFVVAPLDGAGLAGKAAAIVGGAMWAGSIIVLKLVRAKHDVDIVNLTAWQMAYGTVPLAAVAVFDPQHHLTVTQPFLIALAYLTIVGTAAAWLLWAFALSRLAAAAAGIGSLVTPVAVVLMAWALLGERPDAVETTGILLIVAALVANAAPAFGKRAVS